MSASIGTVCGNRRLAGGRRAETVVWRCTVWSLVTLTLGVLVGPLAAQAQRIGQLYRIGFLGNSTAALEANLVGTFREGFRELGYVERQNVVSAGASSLCLIPKFSHSKVLRLISFSGMLPRGARIANLHINLAPGFASQALPSLRTRQYPESPVTTSGAVPRLWSPRWPARLSGRQIRSSACHRQTRLVAPLVAPQAQSE
jgi:hypothetical protein